MTKTDSLPQEVQCVVDAHVDAVEQVLQNTEVTRSERRTICDELEGHINELLTQRFGDAPTIPQAEELLLQLDPPHSWSGSGGLPRTSATPARSALPLAAVATAVALFGVLLPFVYAEWRDNDAGRMVAGIMAILITCLASALGIAAIRQLRSKGFEKRGYFLAFCAAVSLPMVVVLWTCIELAGAVSAPLLDDYVRYRSEQWAFEKARNADPSGATDMEPPVAPVFTTQSSIRLVAFSVALGIPLVLTVSLGPVFYRRFLPRSLGSD